MDNQILDNVLRIFRTLHRLKFLPRQGFIRFGMKRYETDSIAEHSFLVTWITYVLAQELYRAGFTGINRDVVSRATKMALVHDWSEAVTGDLGYQVKAMGYSVPAEFALQSLLDGLPSDTRREILELCSDYNNLSSVEAAIVKIADSLDALFQGLNTPTSWWLAWEDYQKRTENSLNHAHNYPALGEVYSMLCNLAKDSKAAVLLPRGDHLCTDNLIDLINFIRNIYHLKELPRNSFIIFGVRRSETDTFASHMFMTACLSYLFASVLKMESSERHKAIMTALLHNLPAAITGDLPFDVVERTEQSWGELQEAALVKLTTSLSEDAASEIRQLFKEWILSTSGQDRVWIVRAAAALDSWELGITSSTIWEEGMTKYRKKQLDHFINCANTTIVDILNYGYARLAQSESSTENGFVRATKPTVKPIRPIAPK